MYQGLGLRGFENLVIKGACLSRIERRVKSFIFNSLSIDVGGCRINSVEARSLLNSMTLMFLVQRKANSEGGWGDVGVLLR